MSRRVKWALIVAAIVVAGSVAIDVFLSTRVPKTAASTDHFVGTWRSRSPGMTIVIAKAAAGYRVTGGMDSQGHPSSFILSRHGDELTGTFDEAIPPVSLVVTYLPGTGHLAIKSSFGALTELSKVSASTAWPGPQPVHMATGGPQWTKVLSFAGTAPGPAAMQWSARFTIAGGTVRAVGTVTSNDPSNVGLSLALQRWQKARARWVDVNSAIAPHDLKSPPPVSEGTMAADWYTSHPLKAGKYRLGMMAGGGVRETFAFTVYVSK